jgi:hypothetical protein
MKKIPSLLLASLLLVSAGCSAISVSTDYSATAVPDMLQYKTYAWIEFPVGEDLREQSELVKSRVIDAVDRELAAKDYEKDTSGNPDFLIGYHAALQNRTDVEKVTKEYEGNYGYTYGLPHTYTETFVREFREGMLVLDIVDGKSETLVWRGQAQAEVSESPDPETRTARINKAVKKMLEDFPPEG